MQVERHTFEHPNSGQTLAEGLSEYVTANPGLTRGSHLSAEASAFFRCHDTVHIVYGCNTSMPDEAIVKLASIFGTTAGFGVLRGYRLHESLDIYRKLPLVDTLRAMLLAVVLVPRTILRCSRQRRRWPWRGFEEYSGVPLAQLRKEFGITVAHEATVRDA